MHSDLINKSKQHTSEILTHKPSQDLKIENKSLPKVMRTVSIRALIFLTSRPAEPNVGNLLVSLDSGLIQVWTHHPAGGFLTAFSAIHCQGDYVISLATDANNVYLITGHIAGYIKVWLLQNYALPNPPKLSLPLLRLKFPFMWKDKINGPAKIAVKNQSMPILLSSVKCHNKAVTSLQFVPEANIIISGSADHSVRLWTLSGRYLSTFGTYRPWVPIVPNVSISKYFNDYKLPPDIQQTASFTTLKVLKGGDVHVSQENKSEDTKLNKELTESEKSLLFVKQLFEPILGNNYKLANPLKQQRNSPVLDVSLSYIPVYKHLTTHNLKIIKTSGGKNNLCTKSKYKVQFNSLK